MTAKESTAELQLTPRHDAYRCETHGYASNLPCPWPACPNGIIEDRIGGSYFGMQKRYLFERRRYVSLSGEDRFMWRGEVGATFTADRRAQLEIMRLRLLGERNPPRVVYHYTTSDAFLAILRSQEIWLTDYAYLNDYKEVMHGVELAFTAIGSARQRTRDDNETQALSVLMNALSDLSRLRVCVACFSEESDSLPQWRAYGGLAWISTEGNSPKN